MENVYAFIYNGLLLKHRARNKKATNLQKIYSNVFPIEKSIKTH